jgi:hypothetical protein
MHNNAIAPPVGERTAMLANRVIYAAETKGTGMLANRVIYAGLSSLAKETRQVQFHDR